MKWSTSTPSPSPNATGSHRLRWFFLSGGMLWLLMFLVLPMVLLIGLAFARKKFPAGIEWAFTTENFVRLAGFTELYGWTPDLLQVVGRSLLVATITTLLCLALAYPLAFFIARQPPRWRYLWLTLVIIPLCTNLVIRTYAWRLLLDGSFPLARLCAALGITDPGEALYPSSLAIYLGMLTTFLPFAVLPLYASVERLDWSIVEAADDLYASSYRLFLHAIVPQTAPGLVVAVILTFVPAMGMFVVSDLLGGAKFMLIGNLIQQQFGPSYDWPFGAAISLTLMALTLLGLIIYRRWADDRAGASVV